MLRNIARNGDDQARREAELALELTAQTRGERLATAKIGGVSVPAGEKRRTVYDARHGRALPGKRVRGEGDDAVRDAAVNHAYDGAGRTYDFYKRAFSRNSVDGRGLRLDSTVHYGTRYSNALWNGRQMIYGDGDGRYFNDFTASLDVIAHELTHGVVQYSAAFEYDGEPGALNEHFADVFGILAKQHSLKQPARRADWLIGADLFTSRVNGVALRSMKAPGTAYDDPIVGKDPQPDHMRGYVTTDLDNGGVHINSGIPNRAFYELAYALGGRAWESAGRIWYRALMRNLHSRSRFQDCADATWTAAGELFGGDSGPQRAVGTAWKVVGIDVSDQLTATREARTFGEPYHPPAPAAEVPAEMPRAAAQAGK